MRNIAEESRQRNFLKRSRQEMIDKAMCKPGYTWNETLKRCLPAYVGDMDNVIEIPEQPIEKPVPETIAMPESEMPQLKAPDKAIAKEVSKRSIKKR